MGNLKLNDQDLLAIRVMYDRIGNYHHVARSFGFATSTVWRHVKYWGENGNKRKYYPEEVARENGFESFKDFKRNRKKQRKKRMTVLAAFVRYYVNQYKGGQTVLAEGVETSRQAINNIVNERHFPRKDVLERILKALDAPDTLRKAVVS